MTILLPEYRDLKNLIEEICENECGGICISCAFNNEDEGCQRIIIYDILNEKCKGDDND